MLNFIKNGGVKIMGNYLYFCMHFANNAYGIGRIPKSALD